MAGVRVLVGTRKGAFTLTAAEDRRNWTIHGPLFAGWEIYHVAGAPSDPDRLYASQSNGWFGQVIQRSDDGGRTWYAVGSDFTYEGEPGSHLYYDGSSQPWQFHRVWHLQVDAHDPDRVTAGVQDAALFRSEDGGHSWQELSGLRRHASASQWAPGAGGLCVHTILDHPQRPGEMLVGISSAGTFRTDDDGATWRPSNTGLQSDFLPDPGAEVGHCVHKMARHPDRPDVIYLQKHWDVMRSDDAGATWREISGDLPSDFGFAIDVHAHDPDTVYVVPITSDEVHVPPDGRLRVYRSRSGGDHWEPLTQGLPQQDCYVNVLRDAMAVDRLDPCGIYVGTTAGQIFASADEGEHWEPIASFLPAVLSVEVQSLP